MIVGGLRARLVRDSFSELVQQGLTALGWFDPGRSHRPVTMVAKPKHWTVPVKANTITVDFTGSTVEEWEVGSPLTQDTAIAYVEVYAENDSVGLHIANDIRDWLRGRLQATPVNVTFPIYDYRLGATAPILGYMDIRNVHALRNTAISNELWLRHWFRVRCEIRDTYMTSET
jgi:hypothetical protein